MKDVEDPNKLAIWQKELKTSLSQMNSNYAILNINLVILTLLTQKLANRLTNGLI